MYFLFDKGVNKKNANGMIGSNGIALTFTAKAIPQKKQAKRKFLGSE